MARLLLVEDDRELAGLLEELLREEGYDVELARDGQRGLQLGLTREYDVLVLDRGLPALEGLDLLGRLRSKGVTTPVLVLSARGSPADRVEGLNLGAEDYVSKPFDVEELLARLRGLLRRYADQADVVKVPGGAFDIAAREVTLDQGEIVVLSARETDVLEHLARSPRRVFSRAELLHAAFEDEDDEGLVDTYVHHLRRKLGSACVLTVRGVGYRLGRW